MPAKPAERASGQLGRGQETAGELPPALQVDAGTLSAEEQSAQGIKPIA